MRQNAGGKRSHGCGRGAGNEREDHCSQWHSLVFPAFFVLFFRRFNYHFHASCILYFPVSKVSATDNKKLMRGKVENTVCYSEFAILFRHFCNLCHRFVVLCFCFCFWIHLSFALFQFQRCLPPLVFPLLPVPHSTAAVVAPLPFSNWTALWFSNKWV